ncbi:hypothetical protein CE91St38_26970 [Desulfovibrionaceae bacterium]|nr:hypothetical protein CE91St38_26970 [Desulfovibrionaceae bacterium]GKI13241.1 hypothetical protein CE91St39_26950 [Desulfovibrionaceae bacterium]
MNAEAQHVFQRKLLKGIAICLTQTDHRYIDNSLEYYTSLSAEAMRRDKEWFAAVSLPEASAFLRANAQAVALQVMTKGELYSLLADAHSRNLLVQVALFALLGHRFVKFPYHAPTAVSRRTELGKLHAVAESDAIMRDAVANDDFGVGYRLRLFSTSMAEERVTLYSTAEFLYQLEAFPPYRYAKGDVRIDVLPGDHVLDCGACYGDTALLFAAKAGERGRVLSFEPHPDIGRLFLHNMKRNPHLAGRMSMMPAATGNTRDGELVLNLCGPGSYLGDGVAVLRKARVPMTCLDDEMVRRQWPRVDFIKMDVEGAELATLQGAERILRGCRPKLAVCLYHKPEDFLLIPRFLHGLDLGYRFYLEHHFVNNWETVLYALPGEAAETA